jgi:hypothetical protein
MAWGWVWIGAALLLGFYLGVGVMCLAASARESEAHGGEPSRPRPDRRANPCGA